jgi:succinyl-diaminopimelate desuccinylase
MNLLNQLVEIDSSNREGVNHAIEVAAAYLNEAGIDGEMIENQGLKSFIATIGDGAKTIVFNGHLDVVSGKPSQFKPVESEGRLYGRGTADMKAGCVAIIEAAIALKERKPPNRIMVQLVPDEETGGSQGTRYLVERGFVGDFVICAEPTNLAISVQSKGILVVDIDVTGRSAHGSRPWEGESAILKAIDTFRRIEALPILQRGSEFYERSTANLAKISGGDIYNRVPDSCRLGIDIRYIPGLDPDEILRDIRSVTDGKVSVKARESGVNVTPDDPGVQVLQESVAATLGEGIPGLAVQHGGADTRFFAARGISAVEFGPRGAAWHGDDEYVDLKSVDELKEILIDFAFRYSG